MTEHTPAPPTFRTLPVLGTVLVVAMTLAMLIALPVFAAPTSAPAASGGLTTSFVTASGSPVQQWAYGGSKTISGDVTVTGTNGTGFELQYHAFYGWTVVFTQTNNSTNSGFQIEAQRTAAAQLYVELCTPNCASPTWTGNYTASATQTATAFGNFTREGTVYEDGAPSSALGILNASGQTQAALHSELTVTGPVQTRHWFFNVSASAQAQVTFTPELGLIPYNVQPGTSWNSSAAYAFSGAYDLSWTFLGPHSSASGGGTKDISADGTVNLQADYNQAFTLDNHELTHILVMSLSGGPFDLYDGVIILPHAGNVFNGDPSAIGGEGLGVAPAASTAAVDYDSSSGHLGIAAAATNFVPAAAGALPATTLTTDASSTSGGDVQAQPMSVPAAESCATSLLSGGTCVASGGGWISQLFHSTAFEVVALVIGVVALVAVLAVAVGRRPRAPPPVRVPSTASGRVPPGATGQLAPPPRAPPQQPSDPLGNLW